MKGPVLQIPNYRIPMRQGNNRISGRSLSEDPVAEARGFMTDQQLIARNICKKCGQKEILWDTLIHISFHNKIFTCWGLCCKDGRRVCGEGEMSGIGDHDVKLKFIKNHKNLSLF